MIRESVLTVQRSMKLQFRALWRGWANRGLGTDKTRHKNKGSRAGCPCLLLAEKGSEPVSIGVARSELKDAKQLWLAHEGCVSPFIKTQNFGPGAEDWKAEDASSGRGLEKHPRHHHRRHCPCAPGSSRGRTPDDRHAAQRGQLSAGRIPNRSPAFPWQELSDSLRLLPPGRSSLPAGSSCSVWGWNNRVPGRTFDLQQ